MKKSHFTRNLLCILIAALMLIFSGCDLLLQMMPPITQTTDPEVHIDKSELTLEVGQSAQLHATATDDSDVEWMALDEDVAIVDDGLVVAVGVGETIVFAITDNAQDSCVVTVTPSNDKEDPDPDDGKDDVTPSIKLDVTELALEVEQSGAIIATIVGIDATPRWSVDDRSVLQLNAVNCVATVKGLSEGVATVKITAGEYSATCEVTVTDPNAGDDPVVDPDLPDDPIDDPAKKEGYTLVWRDEFDGAALDETKWGYQLGVQDQYGSSTGPLYWGNDELQYYTKEAVTVKDGSLVITATKQFMPNGRSYSSARILTRDKQSWTYGYFEARMKTPTGNGMWPAFWMLPQPSNASSSDNVYGSWPANGEIDIMEAKGRLANVIDTTLHYGGAWYDHEMSGGSTTLSSNIDEWHTYAVEWTSDRISWYIDGKFVYFVTKSIWWSQDRNNKGQSMPFDQPFYILFNLAVGGQYDGYVQPDDDFTSAAMYVDYVRVYKKN